MALTQKIAESLMDLSPTAILDFWTLYYDTVNEPGVGFRFIGSTNGFNGPIIFGGYTYTPIACEVDNISTNSLNRVERPEIRISNEGYQISQLLRRKNDFKNAKLVRVRTFLKFIDDVNFDSGQNPYGIADPNAEISRDTFIVHQKLGENKSFVSLSLSPPYDLANQTTPGRVILGRYCPFQYRGKGCNYCGPPVSKDDDSAFSSTFEGVYDISSARNLWIEGETYTAGQAVYVENEKDPPRTVFVCRLAHIATTLNNPNKPDGAAYWEKDQCSKTITGCKKRFLDDPSNPNYLGYLRFGGFAATETYRLGG